MLANLDENELRRFKADMQEAFRTGALEGGFDADGREILPEKDIDESLNKADSTAYKAVLDGEMVGGAIVVTDRERVYGHLDFLYIKTGMQGRGLGRSIWFGIEGMHPEVRVWETCTPYFDRRNIHFYINVCGFHAVEFLNSHHRDPNTPDDAFDSGDPDMFMFRKVLNRGKSETTDRENTRIGALEPYLLNYK